ncbi:MAG: hypothetical protein DWQ05_18715 [Calditrichaeota bacterium]|nr:MAG: hypothetical protein DWQ05_18715 [Calditrichota bacterium]
MIKIFLNSLAVMCFATTVLAQEGYKPYQAKRYSFQSSAQPSQLTQALQHPFAKIDRSSLQTGILHDRVLSFQSDLIHELTGNEDGTAIDFKQFKAIYFEMEKAALPPFESMPLTVLLQNISTHLKSEKNIPILIGNFRFETTASDALQRGVLRKNQAEQFEIEPFKNESPFELHQLFMAAMPKKQLWGRAFNFLISSEFMVGNSMTHPVKIEIDFDDGSGWRQSSSEQQHAVFYSRTGVKQIAVKMEFTDQVMTGIFQIDVDTTPLPEYSTIPITAEIPYRGEFGELTAYLIKSESERSQNIKQPVVFVEGFDTDNVDPTGTKGFEELWAKASEQNLAAQLLEREFDILLLNFNDGADFIQKNAFALLQLLQEIEQQSEYAGNTTVIGASMGGLVGRYALAHAEKYGLLHHTHTFITFDTPHRGANMPLGVQEWLRYFSGESSEAKDADKQLNTPAAKQMLALHRTGNFEHVYFYDELAQLGFPGRTRNLAIANGSGGGKGYPFEPANKIIDWHFRHFCVDIDGHAYAINSGRIFYGWIDKLGFDNPKSTEIKGPAEVPSWDNSPGGGRFTMEFIASSTPKAKCGFSTITLGNIKAPHPAHSFIPTISALDLATDDLFYPAEMDSTSLSLSPFDEFYMPQENQEHVQITPENVAWLLDKLDRIRIVNKKYGGGQTTSIFAPVSIEMAASHVEESGTLELRAGQEIKLSGEFQAVEGSEFRAQVK